MIVTGVVGLIVSPNLNVGSGLKQDYADKAMHINAVSPNLNVGSGLKQKHIDSLERTAKYLPTSTLGAD